MKQRLAERLFFVKIISRNKGTMVSNCCKFTVFTLDTNAFGSNRYHQPVELHPCSLRNRIRFTSPSRNYRISPCDHGRGCGCLVQLEILKLFYGSAGNLGDNSITPTGTERSDMCIFLKFRGSECVVYLNSIRFSSQVAHV